MNKELKTILEAEYQEDISWQLKNEAQAKRARQTGNEAEYFDFAFHERLPDTCWALERWDESRHWYLHNALILTAAREWHKLHSEPDFPIEQFLDREATTHIKAGKLAEGRELLKKAIAYWKKEVEPELVLSELCLHAAQAGLSRLAHHASAAVEARKLLGVEKSKAAKRIRELLQYEAAEAALLLGQWDQLESSLDTVAEVEQLIKKHSINALPKFLQQALLDSIRGLRVLFEMKSGRTDLNSGKADARVFFEDAMLGFYKFMGGTDWNTYFMRLNTRLAENLADGRAIDANPFAEVK